MLAGDMRNAAAISATAVLAKPSRRNSASAVSMIRARVSSGFVFTCVCMSARLGPETVIIDDFYNSSLRGCQDGDSGHTSD